MHTVSQTDGHSCPLPYHKPKNSLEQLAPQSTLLMLISGPTGFVLDFHGSAKRCQQKQT